MNNIPRFLVPLLLLVATAYAEPKFNGVISFGSSGTLVNYRINQIYNNCGDPPKSGPVAMLVCGAKRNPDHERQTTRGPTTPMSSIYSPFVFGHPRESGTTLFTVAWINWPCGQTMSRNYRCSKTFQSRATIIGRST